MGTGLDATQVRGVDRVSPYAARMVALPDSARAVLQGPHLGHVVTIDPDGAPQVSCVWVGVDGDEVVFGSLGPWRKLRNLERDPRIAVSVESDRVNAIGMREYLVLQGTARVEPGGAPELLQELARVYIGPEVRFPPMDDPPPGSIVRITVDRISGVGPWTD
jgi:PPOX class probable F420-dependent enzyme